MSECTDEELRELDAAASLYLDGGFPTAVTNSKQLNTNLENCFAKVNIC